MSVTLTNETATLCLHLPAHSCGLGKKPFPLEAVDGEISGTDLESDETLDNGLGLGLSGLFLIWGVEKLLVEHRPALFSLPSPTSIVKGRVLADLVGGDLTLRIFFKPEGHLKHFPIYLSILKALDCSYSLEQYLLVTPFL